MMELRIAASTDIGRVRTQNQDLYCAVRLLRWNDAWLLAVADGMGGHAGGQIASRLAITTLQSELEQRSASTTEPSLEMLQQAFHAAHRELLHAASEDPQLKGMGTTLTAAIWHEEQLLVAHVGDSRVYRIDGQRCVQLTEDHSFVAELVRKGDLALEEARLHPQRHLLLRALGTPQQPEVDTFIHPITGDDLVLLVTDGLTTLVNEFELIQILQQHPFEEVPARLIELANERGGYDNITVVIASRRRKGGGYS